MNLLTLVLFVFIVAVLSAAIIKVNASEEDDAWTVVANVIIGICLTASIMFLPFGVDAPKTLFGRAISALNPAKPVKTETVEKPVTLPVTEATEPEEEELPDFIVYECDDYYIKMDREEHNMEIVPSEERLEDVKATEKLAYYCYSTELTLSGHPLNVYAARLSGDDGFVVVVLFDEYYTSDTNSTFANSNNVFRLHDEDNGYMYGYAYYYSSIESARGFYFYIGSNTTYFDGMYDALRLDKKYFE